MYNTTIEPFNFSFFGISGWNIHLYYCDIEWFALEMNRDHSVISEITPKHYILDSFVGYEGNFISSKGFLPTVVDGTLIWIKFAHEDLQDLLEITSKKDVLFIIGDWNAKVGNHEIPWVTGKFDLGVKKETGKRLTDFCQENTLVIANTVFQQQNRSLNMEITRWSISWVSTVQFSCSVVSNSSYSHWLQQTRLPEVCWNSCPSSWWCHPNISSSVIPFSSCIQSCSASVSFPMSQFFPLGVQSIGASASVLPMNIQDWFPLELTGLISLQSKELSRIFSNTIVQKHKFFRLNFLYGPTLTYIHDYWKHHSFDYVDFCQQSNVSVF